MSLPVGVAYVAGPDLIFEFANDEYRRYVGGRDLIGLSADQAAGAHRADLEAQGRYSVDYKRYWVDEQHGKIFCLVEAPGPCTYGSELAGARLRGVRRWVRSHPREP